MNLYGDIVNYLLFFILGSIFGSFINMLIYRIPRDISIVKGRSKCDSCGESLKFRDMIPIVSYFFLKGRCRFCGSKIGIQNLLVELITASLFVIIYYFFGYSIVTIKYIYIAIILILISFIDIEKHIIPDKIMFFNLIIGISFLPFNKISITSSIIGFFIGGGILFILALIGAMGGGDIKLMATMGLLVGYQKILLAIFIAFVIGGIISLILILLGIKGRKDRIAFGPFLSAGTILSILFYFDILRLYFGII